MSTALSPRSSAPRLFWSLDSASPQSRAQNAAAQALKLIEVQKGKLVLARQGVDLLRSLPAANHLNLIFIFGNARSGKSFLMNCLSGVPGLFRVVNSAQPCTKGVDISSSVLPYQTFKAHADSLPVQLDDIQLGPGGADGEGDGRDGRGVLSPAGSPNSSAFPDRRRDRDPPPSIGFVDVEGQGAEDNSHDTMLALPLLLTSRITLFNHRGAPTVSDMLSKLGVLARAADYVDVGDGTNNGDHDSATDSDDEESVARASKKESFAAQRGNGNGGRSKRFGHLHVIFRDFAFEGTRESVYQQLMGLENVQVQRASKGGSKSLNSSASASKSDRDREKDAIRAIQERNDIRNLLHENFQSIHIWLLKQPASADHLKAHKELPESLCDPEFVSEVHKLSVVLAAQLTTPTNFNQTPLTGVRIATLLTQITSSLNTHGAISVPSVFAAMESETVQRVFAEVVAKQEAKLDKIRKSLPISTSSLNAQVAVLCAAAQDSYDQALEACILEEEKKKKRDELVAAQLRARESVSAENQSLLLKLIQRTILDSASTAKQCFDAFCAKVIPIDEARVLEQEMLALRSAHATRVSAALAPFPEAPSLPEYRYAALEAEEGLAEFLAYKLVSNDAQVKEHKIARLQEEAIAQQQLLIEQNKRLEEYLNEEKKNTSAMEEELARLRMDREEQRQKAEVEKQRLAELSAEMEALRKQKKKKDCVIL